MKLNWQFFDLQLKNPLRLSHGLVTYRKSLLVSLIRGVNTGYGEMVFIDYYGHQPIDAVVELERLVSRLIATQIADAQALHYLMDDCKLQNHFLRSAIDCAFYDLISRENNTSLASFLGFSFPKHQISSITVSNEDLANTDRLNALLKWPLLKIKTGYPDDHQIVEYVVKNSKAKFFIDANQGWNFERAKKVTKDLPRDRFLFLEEPFSHPDSDDYIFWKKEFEEIPLYADESFQSIGDLSTLVQVFDGINLKLMKVGGIFPALKLIEKARKLNLKILGGCMMSSAISVLPITHLSSCCDYLDVDGAELVSDSRFTGLSLRQGIVILENPTGIGGMIHV